MVFEQVIAMKYKLYKNNKGFSLIELIIVITIITIVTSVALIGIKTLRLGNATKASKLMGDQITSLRQNTLSVQGTWSIEIVNNNGSYIVNTYRNKVLQKKQDYGKEIRISYHEDNVAKTDLNKNEKLIITFKTGSGIVDKIRRVENAGDMLTCSDITDGINLITGSKQYFVISIAGKNKENYTDINLAYETGKVVAGSLDALSNPSEGASTNNEEK